MEPLEYLPPALTTVVFPPPPPTSNTLTSVQRAQLRKSTKKLGQILGETPRLLDADIVSILGPVHVELPPRNEAPSPIFSDDLDSYSYFSRSSSSLSHCSHPYATASPPSYKSRPSTPRSTPSRKPSLGLRSSLDRLTNHFDPHHPNINKQGPPILQLAVSPPSSPTSPNSVIVSSPSPSSSPTSDRTSGKFNSIHRRSTSVDDDTDNHFSTPFPSSPSPSPSDMKFTLHSSRHSISSSHIGVKNYENENIGESCHVRPSTSPSNARRQKMERLRKMLGEDVPVHLVFPDQEKKVVKDGNRNDSTKYTDYEVISSGESYYSPRGISPVAVAGTAVPRSKTKGKIIGARDSMGVLTPHKANRQETEKPRKVDPSHMKSTSLPSSLPPPPPSPPTLIKATTTLSSPDSGASQKRLCVIVESPEEHGSSALEGFGLGGCTPSMKTRATIVTKKSNVMVQSSREVDVFSTGRNSPMNEEVVMNKVWSTRRGYTGWDRSTTFGRTSESSLLSLEERRRLLGYRKSSVVDF